MPEGAELEEMLDQHAEKILNKLRENFWVPSEKHFLHHQLIDNCQAAREQRDARGRFVDEVLREEDAFWKNQEWASGWRQSTGDTARKVKQISLGMVVLALLSWIGGAAIDWVKAFIQGVKG